MKHWTTSMYGVKPDDGKSDAERYPPPAQTPKDTFGPSPHDVGLDSHSARPTDPPEETASAAVRDLARLFRP